MRPSSNSNVEDGNSRKFCKSGFVLYNSPQYLTCDCLLRGRIRHGLLSYSRLLSVGLLGCDAIGRLWRWTPPAEADTMGEPRAGVRSKTSRTNERPERTRNAPFEPPSVVRLRWCRGAMGGRR